MNKIIYYYTLLLLPMCIFAKSNSFSKIDYARFCIDDSTGKIEIYYKIDPFLLKKTITNNDTLISCNLNLKIVKIPNENIVINKSYNFSKSFKELRQENINSLYGVLSYILPNNKYTCHIEIKDKYDLLKQTNHSFDFNIKTLKKNNLSVSDIQLASSIVKGSQTNSIFYKNHYEVIPNIDCSYGTSNPVIYFYNEIYNLNKYNEGNNLFINYFLINNKSDTLYKKSKNIPPNLPSFALADAINISKYQSGKYILSVNISDVNKKVIESTSKKLNINNSHLITSKSTAVHAEVISSEFGGYSESELDEIYNFSKYVASNNERENWKRLKTENEKKVFLYLFWKSKQNIKSEYFKRVEYTNKKFSSIFKKGWATDRGRVYCIYGKPSDIERFISTDASKPHEIWRYYKIEGGAIFVFADLYGFSDYSLVHSTKQGELRDDNWVRKIKID